MQEAWSRSSMSSDAICKNLGQVSDIAIEVVLFHYSASACFTEATAQVGFLDQALDSIGQRLIVRRRNQNAIHVVANQFRNAGDESAYARYFHRHSFHQHHRDTFGKAGEHEYVGLTIIGADAILV